MAQVLLYDGECRFCRRSSAWLVRLGGRRVERLPRQSAAAAQLLAGLALEPRAGELNLLLDGRLYGGAEAVVRTLGLHPAWRLVTWVYFVPGIRQVADTVYRWIAARRHCLGGRCAAFDRTGRSAQSD